MGFFSRFLARFPFWRDQASISGQERESGREAELRPETDNSSLAETPLGEDLAGPTLKAGGEDPALGADYIPGAGQPNPEEFSPEDKALENETIENQTIEDKTPEDESIEDELAPADSPPADQPSFDREIDSLLNAMGGGDETYAPPYEDPPYEEPYDAPIDDPLTNDLTAPSPASLTGAELVQPVTVLDEDRERRLLLETEGLLDEPRHIDLDSQDLEDKLLGDLESFFLEEQAEISEATGASEEDFLEELAPGATTRPLAEGEAVEDAEGLDQDAIPLDDPSLWPPGPESDSELGELRELLMGRELSQLSYLTRVLTRPSQRADFLGQVITEALLLRTRRDDKLSTVLAPTVEKIVTASVRRDPENLASQIFPAIGPAIRRSISETFVSKLQDLNSTLETSFSLRGLKWRLEALRVKKPFSEIVLLHTLLYHIEEIYLIHASTGLVLDHLISEETVASRDADMVAGMFTAIQDFVRDSFKTTQHENLDTLRFGERTIFLRRTSQVYLACVVRGNPPESLNKDLQEALELMVVDCAEELDNFNGDANPFKKCRVYFQDFLKARYQDKPHSVPKIFWILALSAIFLFLFYNVVSSIQTNYAEKQAAMVEIQREERLEKREETRQADHLRFNAALDLVNNEPGLVVVNSTEAPDGRFDIVCLKDSLARDPEAILVNEGKIPPNRLKVTVRPFISLDAEIVSRRVKEAIKPLPTVNLVFDPATGELTLTGEAPLGWIMAAKETAIAIPGVVRVATDNLVDPRSSEVERLVKAINGVVIHFPTNKDEPVPEDRPLLIEAVDNLVALEKLAQETQMQVNLVIYGHTDSTGQDRRNFELSEQRTKTIAALLYARGSSLPISNYGLGSQFSSRGEDNAPVDDLASRRIELRVRLTQLSLNPVSY
ncbi:MAG: OmpA family protein [Deltaproteobacteria bacterium]|jgi:OOP family OmpA-OmpF porin|nr:OmpA family protein [Deltaproteobacteria bacterium]